MTWRKRACPGCGRWPGCGHAADCPTIRVELPKVDMTNRPKNKWPKV